jgi:hypothetical protein
MITIIMIIINFMLRIAEKIMTFLTIVSFLTTIVLFYLYIKKDKKILSTKKTGT